MGTDYILPCGMKKWYISEDFKDLRSQLFISVEELMEKSGLGRNTIFQIQRGDVKSPRKETLDKIARALGMSYARDERGIYFYEPATYSEELKTVARADVSVKDEKYAALPPEEQKLIDEFIEFYSRQPEKKKKIIDKWLKLMKEDLDG